MRRPRPRLRVPGTVRLRLAMVLGGLFLASGALLLAITYLLVAHHPPVTADIRSHRGSDLSSLRAARQAAARQDKAAQLDQLLAESGIALAIMTAVSGGLGWLVAGRLLRPLRAMGASMRRISEHNLHQRLGLPGPRDELTDLSDIFDGLLERLQGAFDAQRQFVANASHELRTPLTVERTVIEVALADPDVSVDSLRATCGRVLANAQHQERLIEAMLTLARSQRGLGERRPLDLATAAAECVDVLGADPAGRGPRLDCDLRPAAVSGDHQLIERLVTNLVDNALRYNVPGGWVRLCTWTEDGQAVLRVINSGQVIAASQIDTLLQPFRRLPAGRTRHRDGLGLGLSIVAAIAAAHQAALRAAPGPEGGLDVTVAFAPAGPPA